MYDITRFNNNYMTVRRVRYYLLAVDAQFLIKNDKNMKLSTNYKRQTTISMSPSLQEKWRIGKKNNFI